VFVRRGTAYANIGNHDLGMFNGLSGILVIHVIKQSCLSLLNCRYHKAGFPVVCAITA